MTNEQSVHKMALSDFLKCMNFNLTMYYKRVGVHGYRVCIMHALNEKPIDRCSDFHTCEQCIESWVNERVDKCRGGEPK